MVYLYAHDGNSWIPEAKLCPSNASETFGRFGSNVHLAGSSLLVAASEQIFDQGVPEYRGLVYEYRHSQGSWLEVGVIDRLDGRGYAGLGVSLAGDAEHTLIGAPGAPHPLTANPTGALFVLGSGSLFRDGFE